MIIYPIHSLPHIFPLPSLPIQEQVEKMKKEQERLEKQLAETQAENRRLQEPLQKARDELAELKKQLTNYERDKLSLANAKARLKVQESELKSLRWEHEVLEQRFAQVQSVSEIDASSSLSIQDIVHTRQPNMECVSGLGPEGAG